MSTVTLTRVFRKDIETRFGIKPKVSIQTQEHGDKWLSSFKVQGTEDWEEGMTVQVNISEKGDFINFIPVGGSTATKTATVDNSAVEKRLSALEDAVFGTKDTRPSQPSQTITPVDFPEDEPEVDTGF